MSLALSAKSVVHLDNRYWVLDGRSIKEIESLESVAGVRHIYSDFEGALQGHETVSSPKRYAHIVLEKQLRVRGDTSEASTVITFDKRSVGKSTVLSYLVLPSEQLAKIRSEHERHHDHSLTIPMMSLLHRYGASLPGETIALVLQHGLMLDFMVLDKKKNLSCARITSAGTQSLDWVRAIDFLAGELDQLVEKQELVLDELIWLDWDPDEIATLVAPAELMRKRVSLKVVQPPMTNFQYSNKTIGSTLPGIFSETSSNDAILSLDNKFLYLAERFLPWMCTLLVAVSIALYAAAEHFDQRITGLHSEVSRLDTNASSNWENVSVAEIDDVIYQNSIALIQQFDQAANIPSLPSMIAEVRQSTPPLITIIGISLEIQSPHWQLIVEGFVDDDFSVVNRELERMINALKGYGYDVQDNGLVTRDENHLIQLALTKRSEP
jgi:hypothetical protein